MKTRMYGGINGRMTTRFPGDRVTHMGTAHPTAKQTKKTRREADKHLRRYLSNGKLL